MTSSGSALRDAVRRVPVLRRAAGGVVDRVVLAGRVPPPGLRAGRGATAGTAGSTEPLLLLLTGTTPDAVAATAADLGRLVLAVPGLRPVLVLDAPAFSTVRRAGFAVDHVLSRSEWQARHPDLPYAGHLAERLAQLRRLYASDWVQVLPGSGTADLDLDVLAEACRARLAAARTGRVRGALVGVLRRIDPPVLSE
jgi:hypothetical protein